MRPVRFVALAEDGQAIVLADEVGQLLTLPIDDRVSAMLRPDHAAEGPSPLGLSVPTDEEPRPLSPREIQARIRAGDSPEVLARVAGVPVERVLRYAGPVLQERAMIAQHARRTALTTAVPPTPSGSPGATTSGVVTSGVATSGQSPTLAEVVDPRLRQHGADPDSIAWDAYRHTDNTWRIVATWPSGRTTATAVWVLDKARQHVAPYDDMAHFLSGGIPHEAHRGHEVATPRPTTSGHEPMSARPTARPGRDPIRSGRDALLATLDRPLGTPASRGVDPLAGPASSGPSAAASGEAPRRRTGGRSLQDLDREQDLESADDAPTVPSLAVLRPRRVDPATTGGATSASGSGAGAGSAERRPVRRGPAWEDVMFGPAKAAEG